MLKSLKKVIYSLFFLFVVYIFIYSPYIRMINMGIGKLIVFAAIVYFTINFKLIKYFLLFKLEIFLILVLIFYVFLASLWGDGSTSIMPYLHFQFIIDCILVPIFLYNIFKSKIDFKILNNYIIVVGTIASIITIYLIFNPLFNIYLRENIIVDDLDSGTVQDSLKYIRGFTFSESSTFGFGITQGIIFGLAFNETKNNNKYYIPLLLLIISILFNARVGFVVIIISFLLLYKRINFSLIFYTLIFVTLSLSYFLSTDFANENSQTLEWATSFFSESFDFFSGKKDSDSTYDALTGRMFFFPDSLFGILFGDGKTVMGRDIGSDIGYVNQIFTGGLVYLFLLIFTLWVYYLNFVRVANKNFITSFFILIILIVNYKGSAMFTSHSFLRLFSLVFVVMKCMKYDETLKYRYNPNYLISKI